MVFVAPQTGSPGAAYEVMRLRPAVRADGASLRALCAAAAPAELAWLAGGTMTPAEFARGAGDPAGISLVAQCGEGSCSELVGLARLCVDPDRIAGEFAVLVHAHMRGRGIGRLLLDRLLADCRRRDLILVRAAALPDNTAMLALARACRFDLLPAADGTVELAKSLAPRAEDGR